MIKVEHLNKTYVGKNKEKSRGLIDVSFILPSTGFVFVLGKSGSGKSTLLNLLGSLDNKNGGKIYIDNKDLDNFNQKELSLYRSSYCGFIFQDYQLINELTVKENIALSLEIIDDTEDIENRVNDIIKKVGLEGFENRNVSNLSGGQKQRVSIARALIKNPKLILCDEPTGNLDSVNATSILNLLKEISKNRLVFMVSHDEKSSLLYADRRIILKEGLIIKDEHRNNDYDNRFKIVNDIAYLPFGKTLSNDERTILNEAFKNKQIKEIKQLSDGFIPFNNIEENVKDIELTDVNINKHAKNKLTKLYFSKGKFFSICNIVLFSLISILLILIQTLLSFDSNKVFLDNFSLNEREQFLITKINNVGRGNSGTYLQMSEEDKENLFANYDGEKYEVNNFTLSFYVGNGDELEGGNVTTKNHYFNQHQVYIGSTSGTAVVDEQFLLNKYQNEFGEIEVLAGSLENCTSSLSLIITDYIADSIIDTYSDVDNSYTYDDLIGKIHLFSKTYFTMSTCYSGEVGCIIKTNYKEKYQEVFEKYEMIKNGDFDISKMQNLILSDAFSDYRIDVLNSEISLGYTLNPNFLSDLKENVTTIRNFTYAFGIFASTCEEIIDRSFQYNGGFFYINDSLGDDEIVISTARDKDCKKLFGTKEYINKELYFIKKDGNTIDGRTLSSHSLKISGNAKATYINSNNVKKFVSMQIFNYAYLIPISSNSDIVINNALNSSLSIVDSNSEIYILVSKTTNLYGDLFRILEIIIIVLLIIYFLIYSIKSIKDKSYQIGVFKSLGMKDKDTIFIFLSKNVIFAILTILLTSILSYPFFVLANHLIINAYSSFTNYLLSSINIFYFHFDIFLIVYLCIIAFFIIFTLIPLFIYKRISPAKIVNNKNE